MLLIIFIYKAIYKPIYKAILINNLLINYKSLLKIYYSITIKDEGKNLDNKIKEGIKTIKLIKSNFIDQGF